ncbi:hypothetical protein GGF37_003521, partial [Kickxella alabastrina]
MALLTDQTFLIYQLRVSFLRSSDPTGERILTFDDLSTITPGRRRQSSTPPGSNTTGRRSTAASEIRRHVLHAAQPNAYIIASGYCPETDQPHSPEIHPYDEHTATPSTSRPTPRLQGESSGGRRAKQSNRNAKVAPTREGREEVVGLGVVPQHPDVLDAYSETDTMRRSLDTVRQRRPQAMVADKTWSEVP